LTDISSRDACLSMQRESGGTEATVPKRYTFGSQLGIFKLMLLFILAVSTLWAQALNEMLLSADTAYNPIPSPDGKMIAYARAGWGRPDGIVGLGLSDLVSEVFVMHEDGAPVTASPLTDRFLAGWTPNRANLWLKRQRWLGASAV
jgi:hypothetical protein